MFKYQSGAESSPYNTTGLMKFLNKAHKSTEFLTSRAEKKLFVEVSAHNSLS